MIDALAVGWIAAPAIVTLDKYAPYIIGSYAAAAVIFGALIAYMIARNGAVRRKLSEAEQRRDADRTAATEPEKEQEHA